MSNITIVEQNNVMRREMIRQVTDHVSYNFDRFLTTEMGEIGVFMRNQAIKLLKSEIRHNKELFNEQNPPVRVVEVSALDVFKMGFPLIFSLVTLLVGIIIGWMLF